MMTRPNPPASLSCVIPAFNEACNLGQLVPRVLEVLATLSPRVEIIVVDDGSHDNTPVLLQGLCAAHRELVCLRLSRNFGKEAALTAGLDVAQGEVVVLLDADGQHPVSLLPEMVRHWQQGLDVVYAVRQTRHDQSNLQARLTGLFYALINFGNRVKIPPHAGDFRLMDQRVVQALRGLPERNRFMKGLYAWVGFNSTAIAYEPLARTDGQSNFGLRGALALALTGMLAFSVTPLRLLTLLGLVLSVLALGYGAWVMGEFFISGVRVPGYATIVVGMMFLSGVQLLCIGILAEYVGRIYEEVKQRPPYLISQRTGAGLSKPAGAPPQTAQPTQL